jgi:hypothetical protein
MAGWALDYPLGGVPTRQLQDPAIGNIAVLLTRRNPFNFIAVSGSIGALDLFHIGGHFGIPKNGRRSFGSRARQRPVVRLRQKEPMPVVLLHY